MLLKKLYDKLVAKVNNTDIGRFVLATKYATDKLSLKVIMQVIMLKSVK